MKNKERMCFGIIIGTRAYFNSELAKDVRKQLLKTLADEGYDYVNWVVVLLWVTSRN